MSNLEKMMRALSALQLELHPSIAADVREKVLAVYIEQDSEITKLREAIVKLESYAHGSGCNIFDYGKSKYFSHVDGMFEFHETKEDAIVRCKEELESFRDNAEDGWPDEVNYVCWGEIKQRAKECNIIYRCEDTNCDGDCGLSHRNFDYECDYELEDA
jgi:hypothetical protein